MKRRWGLFLCRWIGHHDWDCDGAWSCNLDHRCRRCGRRPARSLTAQRRA